MMASVGEQKLDLWGDEAVSLLQQQRLPGVLAALQEGDLTDRDGNPVSLAALAEKPLVALYFGAGWCPPCRQFSPHLSSVASTNSASLAVVFVSVDRSEQEMLTFAQVSTFLGPAATVRTT